MGFELANVMHHYEQIPRRDEIKQAPVALRGMGPVGFIVFILLCIGAWALFFYGIIAVGVLVRWIIELLK